MDATLDLHSALRQYWGYDSFRPPQERIVQSVLDGRDVAVVMPTGGGKSLCYQLPAVVLGQTVVVVSPLISLMQDQSAHLAQMGIPAGVLNSSLPADEQRDVMRRAVRGEFRLLYLSPERLAREDTVSWLQRVRIALFAIDEAHCISEWGHEFRPEYRQLSRLRTSFPDVPIAAFTASATQRVRHDILHQLQLQDPAKFIVSFHRPNLRYLVRECDTKSQTKRLLAALQAHHGANVIIYVPTVKAVGETVDLLRSKRIPAIGYHGQMNGDDRRRNQEKWMSDEVPILVGTIAFGLGINKPSVRAVIHLGLPKSVEAYYQEAGRAGRDGDPADCLLLWRRQDTALLAYFIDQLQDLDEKERAWARYRAVKRFVDLSHCRHREICQYFGEKPKWASCNVCDACGNIPDWLDEGIDEQPSPARRKSGATTTARARRAEAEAPPPARHKQVDPALFAFLRDWRNRVARDQRVPSYIVLPDAAVTELCLRRPETMEELLHIVGIGQRKAELYGEQILDALHRFDMGERAAPPPEREVKETPAEETIRLLAEGKSLPEIAEIRGRTVTAVASLVSDLVERGRLFFNDDWVDRARRARIEEVASRLGLDKLKPIKEALPDEITYEDIYLVVAHLRRVKESA